MFQNIPKKVNIIEVGPRDGLQNEKQLISTQDKFEFIKKLLASGIKQIEITSFVRSEKIPQMKDARKLFQQVQENLYAKGLSFFCLVPNMKGMEVACELNVKDVAFFTSTSEEFNKKNINMSVDQSLGQIGELTKEAIKNKMNVRLYLSTVFGCPYEGNIPLNKIRKILDKLRSFGDFEISLGDTIGVATPMQVDKLLKNLKKDFNFNLLAMHFHDTRGMALANILTSLENGICNFDSSAGGLGGCPYAKGATGNVATEDLIYLFHSLGIKTNIDLPRLAEASKFILTTLKKETSSKYLSAYFNTGKY